MLWSELWPKKKKTVQPKKDVEGRRKFLNIHIRYIRERFCSMRPKNRMRYLCRSSQHHSLLTKALAYFYYYYVHCFHEKMKKEWSFFSQKKIRKKMHHSHTHNIHVHIHKFDPEKKKKKKKKKSTAIKWKKVIKSLFMWKMQ